MNKLLILVVEDDKPVRNLICTTLKAHDYRYVEAPTGEAAIMEATSHNPEVILLDLGLPDMDGVELIHKIRAWSMAPIIVISARSEDSDTIQGPRRRGGRLLDQALFRGGTVGPAAGDPAQIVHDGGRAVGGKRRSSTETCALITPPGAPT